MKLWDSLHFVLFVVIHPWLKSYVFLPITGIFRRHEKNRIGFGNRIEDRLF